MRRARNWSGVWKSISGRSSCNGMGPGYYVKAAVKAVTTQETRERIKRQMFLAYTKLFFSGERRIDKDVPLGVNLVGHIRGDFGLGESCRLVAGALQETGIPFSVFNISKNGAAGETNTQWANRERNDLPYGVNIIHLNPDELAKDIWKLRPSELKDRYNIAFWLWELEDFPEEWSYVFRLFDEIWTPAEFISNALRKVTALPVYTMPYGLVTPKTDPSCGRGYFGLPEDKFLVLISYDGLSVSARKNPEGAIRAFAKAFSPSEHGVGLVIKATHESGRALDRLRSLLAGYPNVFILTESYSREKFNSLIRCVDAYVSLHRAEGFGLVMAEAMLLGTPVIATNWSANTEFMNGDTACMVDGPLVELEKDYLPYRAGYRWAAPDEEQAAVWMRKLYEDSGFRISLAEKAKAHLEKVYSQKRAAERMARRLQEIEQGNR